MISVLVLARFYSTVVLVKIIIPLDELPPHHITREALAESVERSHRWEVRSLYEHLKDSNQRKQAIFCVVHGGTDIELRTHSLEYLTSLPWDGYAIGGSLGEYKSYCIITVSFYLYRQPLTPIRNGLNRQWKSGAEKSFELDDAIIQC